jgi:hypothetical protein
MKDSTYHFLTRIIGLFIGKWHVIGKDNLPTQGPAVFIGNHLDATGPLGTATTFPFRMHYWVIADMMDKDLATKWLQWDFCERQLHLKPPLNRWFSKVLCNIAVPLFHSLEFIPVYREDKKRLPDTLRLTVDRLLKDQFVFIFPEDNRLPVDPITRMQPFQYTFARLGEIYYEKTHQRLAFIPVVVHSAGYVWVGKPVLYDPNHQVGIERRRLLDYFEKEIARMYLELVEHASRIKETNPARQ